MFVGENVCDIVDCVSEQSELLQFGFDCQSSVFFTVCPCCLTHVMKLLKPHSDTLVFKIISFLKCSVRIEWTVRAFDGTLRHLKSLLMF